MAGTEFDHSNDLPRSRSPVLLCEEFFVKLITQEWLIEFDDEKRRRGNWTCITTFQKVDNFQ